MGQKIILLTALIFCFVLFTPTTAQVGVICGETGASPWLSAPVVYGVVTLSDFDLARSMPKVTVTLTDANQRSYRYNLERSGNYCFRNIDGSGSTLAVDIEGTEIVRRSLPFGGRNLNQFRQDFEVIAPKHLRVQRAAVISARFAYSRPDTTRQLFSNGVAAEKEGDSQKALRLFRSVVEADASDFVAWAKVGNLYYEMNQLVNAENSYKKALTAKPDYPMATMNLGRVYLSQNKIDEAVESLVKTTVTEPNMARGFQLLGEALLLARKGTLAVEALNEAIRLDPNGMAECHLLMARLYDVAGLKVEAARQFKLFLQKEPEHPDKKKFQKYVKENPVQ